MRISARCLLQVAIAIFLSVSASVAQQMNAELNAVRFESRCADVASLSVTGLASMLPLNPGIPYLLPYHFFSSGSVRAGGSG